MVENDEALNDMKKLERFVMVALWCIQENPHFKTNHEDGNADACRYYSGYFLSCPCPFTMVS